jgi:DNA-binding transcriptional regulator YdaS (Cro superfamily)
MESHLTPQQAFNEALNRAGSQAALASVIGKKQPAISKRLNGSCRAEPDEAVAIERKLGVSRHLLRPDIFGLVAVGSGDVDCDTHPLSQPSRKA